MIVVFEGWIVVELPPFGQFVSVFLLFVVVGAGAGDHALD